MIQTRNKPLKVNRYRRKPQVIKASEPVRAYTEDKIAFYVSVSLAFIIGVSLFVQCMGKLKTLF